MRSLIFFEDGVIFSETRTLRIRNIIMYIRIYLILIRACSTSVHVHLLPRAGVRGQRVIIITPHARFAPRCIPYGWIFQLNAFLSRHVRIYYIHTSARCTDVYGSCGILHKDVMVLRDSYMIIENHNMSVFWVQRKYYNRDICK